MQKRVYRTVLIGAGMIANSAHIPAMMDLGDRFKLVGVQDVRKEAAQFTAQKYGIPFYKSAKEMLEELKPDLAVVTTPNGSHAELSVLALDMGCHVVCEKPLAMTYQDAKRVYQKASQMKRHFMAAQTSRFGATVSSLFELIEMGILGEIYYCDAEVLRRRGVPKWGMFHMKEANGGGSFADQSVHLIDALVHANQAPKPLTVTGCAYNKITSQREKLYYSNSEAGAYGGEVFKAREYRDDEFGVEEFASAFIRFENGLTMQIKSAWAINLEGKKGAELRLAGTKGGIHIPDIKEDELRIYTNMGPYRMSMQPKIVDNTGNKLGWGHWGFYRHVVNVLDGDDEFQVTPREGMITALILEMFYRSCQENREIHVNEIVSGTIGE